jgi:DNA polymerase-3 subunit delta'
MLEMDSLFVPGGRAPSCARSASLDRDTQALPVLPAASGTAPYWVVSLIPLYGHEALRTRLAEAAVRGALPSSILLHGPQGVGKQRLGLWLGQLLLCRDPAPPCGRCQTCRYTDALTHPDLHWIFPRPRGETDASAEEIRADYGAAIAERVASGGLYATPSGSDAIYVATVRAILRTASLAPALAHRKVYVIGDAERMVPQEGAEAAANAFLKMLEEPPADTTIILTSSVPGSLLPTIRSRVVAIRVPYLSDIAVRAFLEEKRVREALAEAGGTSDPGELVRLAGGAPGTLIGREDAPSSRARARRMLEAAVSPRKRPDRLALALSAGAARARAGFTDTLDALTGELHGRARERLAAGDSAGALAASTAVECVDRVRTLAGGNVSPQLLTATLLSDMAKVLGG